MSEPVADPGPAVSSTAASRFCPNCGTSAPAGLVFCTSCGTNIETGAIPAATAHVQHVAPASTAAGATKKAWIFGGGAVAVALVIALALAGGSDDDHSTSSSTSASSSSAGQPAATAAASASSASTPVARSTAATTQANNRINLPAAVPLNIPAGSASSKLGPNNVEAATQIADAMKKAGVEMRGTNLLVMSIVDTNQSMLILDVDQAKVPANAPQPDTKLINSLLATPAMKSASISRLTLVYRTTDKQGPLVSTITLPITTLEGISKGTLSQTQMMQQVAMQQKRPKP